MNSYLWILSLASRFYKNETTVEQQFTYIMFTDRMVVHFFSAPLCILYDTTSSRTIADVNADVLLLGVYLVESKAVRCIGPTHV